ncbi:UDP-glucose 4-epimerase GalE [Spelaeicoccus albus]|uniref:UDP-glucose 4-epimerase n=1 Tax=Spelaeicoccus albus TaxID=1280376 RepID=A0A7Z0AB89_9MICO|nr:UDP-glucose 4-epimerase GalE [Spelaeicoccus albus]NYI66463.1 UDP-glucose 4-epimerase [Spelaeicoccus albus]
MTVLLTGGAGYIGAHVARLLKERDFDVVVVDDLTTGDSERIAGTDVVSFDLSADAAANDLSQIMKSRDITSVVHVAGKKQVGESVNNPTWYYRQNVHSMTNLLTAMQVNCVERLVFSSSAAVYGMPDVEEVDERVECSPINPYGQSKLVCEWMSRNAALAWGLRVANLRYFNVAGSGWSELKDPSALNLIPIVLKSLVEHRQPVVFGSNYPTPDGTCIRDYVHVLDLAAAHIDALEYLDRPDRSYDTFNVGTGTGASVYEVVNTISSHVGRKIQPVVDGRRAGDPARLIANVARIQNELGWKASYGLSEIISSAI